MNYRKWQTSTSPREMFRELTSVRKQCPWITERRLRLFMCAINFPEESLERPHTYERLWFRVNSLLCHPYGDKYPAPLICLALRDLFGNPFLPHRFANKQRCQRCGMLHATQSILKQSSWTIVRHQATLCHYPVPKAFWAWNDRTVFRVAQTIYETNQIATLPILADALEDAGYQEAEVLNHLRSPGPHYRGCWALDLVLGHDFH